MKALIFAAGLGTRLAPITNHIPKALVNVGGMTALEHTIRKISQAGITDIIVNVHHFSEKVKFFLEENEYFGLNISVSDESDLLLDTGGGLLKAVREFSIDEPILLHNADILTVGLPLSEMIESFNSNPVDATLLTWDRGSSRQLLFDSDGIMKGWKNMTTGEVRPGGLSDKGLIPLSFGGIHIVAPSAFPLLERYADAVGKVFSITDFYISACSQLKIQSYVPKGTFQWWDIGKPATLALARTYFDTEAR